MFTKRPSEIEWKVQISGMLLQVKEFAFLRMVATEEIEIPSLQRKSSELGVKGM